MTQLQVRILRGRMGIGWGNLLNTSSVCWVIHPTGSLRTTPPHGNLHYPPAISPMQSSHRKTIILNGQSMARSSCKNLPGNVHSPLQNNHPSFMMTMNQEKILNNSDTTVIPDEYPCFSENSLNPYLHIGLHWFTSLPSFSQTKKIW